MKKKELINAISTTAKLTKKDAENALNAVMNSITDLLAKGDSIVLPGFVSISVKRRRHLNRQQTLTLATSAQQQCFIGPRHRPHLRLQRDKC